MVKPLAFKGDKKAKKRKRTDTEETAEGAAVPTSKSLVSTTTTQDTSDEAEGLNWVNVDAPLDVSGPTLIVLPTTPVTALATDAHGKVFASQLENIDPSGHPSTAEPHDVRQVWIANRVAGSEKVSLKGHHQRYLGCDKVGVLSANREAISAEETWSLVPAPDVQGAFALQSIREGHLGVEQDEESTKSVEVATKVRGDLETIQFGSTVRLRMQARFKPKLKVAKEEKAREKISRKELEDAVGRRLEDDEVKTLKRARREGGYHEALLDVKVKGKHDKFA